MQTRMQKMRIARAGAAALLVMMAVSVVGCDSVVAGLAVKAPGAERAGLVSMIGATDLETTATKLCGYRAETVTYTAPPMGQ